MDDEFAKELIKKYTLLDKDTIEAVIVEHDTAPQKRVLQRRLADESIRVIHGDERLKTVYSMLSVFFENGNPDELLNGNIDDLAAEMPVVEAGLSVIDVLTTSLVADSKASARRLVSGGGVKINDKKIDNGEQIISSKTLINIGKNKFVLVR